MTHRRPPRAAEVGAKARPVRVPRIFGVPGIGIVVANCLALALSLTPQTMEAQSAQGGLPFALVPLEDLSTFRMPVTGWRVAGDVAAERRRDLHLEPAAGSGVLVNLPGRNAGQDLFTDWEHGDIELHLEFMVPRGSNSGIYLQGRYEVQIFDSWGVRNPTAGDAGGIYERWDEARPEGRRGHEGHAPRINASRAPGLWQSMEILFRAPRFDAQGNKIANARFVRVVHNGVVIHENVDLTGPTRGAVPADERPLGPLRLQGDHGPVAFRNIRYKLYSGDRLTLTDLHYRLHTGQFATLAEATAGEPEREGTADAISSALARAPDRFALQFDGILQIPVSGVHRFELGFDWVTHNPHFAGVEAGGARLEIGGREVLLHRGLELFAAGEVELQAGRHPFRLTYYKNRPLPRPGITLMAEGPGLEPHALHDDREPPASPPPLIALEPGGEASTLRGFIEHAASVRTHAISVGDPEGVHYAYDLAQGALLAAWRGPFLETNDMWQGRGERQLAVPQGSVLPFSGAPTLALLADPAQSWPDSILPEHGFRLHGYDLDRHGRPTFRYEMAGARVTDRILPAENGAVLRRELTVSGPLSGGDLYVRLAEGQSIRQLRDGGYAVGDRTYFVELERGSPRPVVRDRAGGQELLLPLRARGGSAGVAYTIIW